MNTSETDDRQLDVGIAGLLGLDVLGETVCIRDPEFNGEWRASPYLAGQGDGMQYVYLATCICHQYKNRDVIHFGHTPSCLKVVPFYYKSDTLALDALERVCDERTLVVAPVRTFDGIWITELYTSKGDKATRGRDKSFPLAICKALAQLENEAKGEQHEYSQREVENQSGVSGGRALVLCSVWR